MKKRRHKKSYKTIKKRSIKDIFKIFRYRVCWIIFFALFVGVGLTYFLIFSTVFQIKTIEISGTQKSSHEEIKNIIAEGINKNIFLADLKNVSERISQKYPQILEIIIKKKFPNRLLVEIKERKQVVAFCQKRIDSFFIIFGQRDNKECFFVDSQGVIFEKAIDLPSDILIIKKNELISYLDLGRKIIEKNLLDKVLKIKSEFENKIEISEVLLFSERKLKISTSEGWKIYFNPQKDMAWQMEKLNILLKEKISSRGDLEYVDLRFEKVYIKRSN